MVASEATRPAGNSAAARKLQRNKNIVSSAATADQLRSSSKADYTRGVAVSLPEGTPHAAGTAAPAGTGAGGWVGLVEAAVL